MTVKLGFVLLLVGASAVGCDGEVRSSCSEPSLVLQLPDGTDIPLDADARADKSGVGLFVAAGDFELDDDTFVMANGPSDGDEHMALLRLLPGKNSQVVANQKFVVGQHPSVSAVVRSGPGDLLNNESARGQVVVKALSSDRICLEVAFQSDGFKLDGFIDAPISSTRSTPSKD